MSSSSSASSPITPKRRFYAIVVLRNSKAVYAKPLKPKPEGDGERCYHNVWAINSEMARELAVEHHNLSKNKLGGGSLFCKLNVLTNKEKYDREVEKVREEKTNGGPVKKRKRDSVNEKNMSINDDDFRVLILRRLDMLEKMFKRVEEVVKKA